MKRFSVPAKYLGQIIHFLCHQVYRCLCTWVKRSFVNKKKAKYLTRTKFSPLVKPWIVLVSHYAPQSGLQWYCCLSKWTSEHYVVGCCPLIWSLLKRWTIIAVGWANSFQIHLCFNTEKFSHTDCFFYLQIFSFNCRSCCVSVRYRCFEGDF